MAERKTTKKVVRVEVDESASERAASSDAAASTDWKPSAEAKGQATGLRWGAAAFWAGALIGEGLAIYWLLWLEPFKPAALVDVMEKAIASRRERRQAQTDAG